MAQRPAYAPTDERSLKDLFSEMNAQLSLLVRKEVELAKVEMKQKASLGAKGAGALAVGGVAALLAVMLLSFAAAWGLAEVLAPGLAFLVVGVVHLVVAAVMLSSGRKKLGQMKPPVPELALSTVKQDVQATKGSFQRGLSGSVSRRPSSGLARRR